MESVVQCPVCTLFLHPGMNLEDHLNTHPKDQVIQALSQLTLQRANILSGTQFSPAKSVSPTLPTHSTPATAATTIAQNAVPTNNCSTNDVNGNQFSFASSSNNRKDTALLIQVQSSPTTPVTGPSSATSSRTSPQLFNYNRSELASDYKNQHFTNYNNSAPKNLMIVNQYVQQQRITTPTSPPKRSQPPPQSTPIAITYTEQQQSLIPRYTSERYSGPPPPYSTAISSTSFNNFTSIASRDTYLPTGGSSNENSSSSYEVKAHYMEKEDGNFLVTESPQKIVEYSEDENGVLTLSEKIVKSPPRLVPCSANNSEDEAEAENDERIENVSEAIPGETLYASEPILVEKVEKMTVESLDEVTHTTNTPKNKKKTTNGLKVLSNVKITTDMISPGLQEILLNNNRKGRRINKILNKRPQKGDIHSPSPPPVTGDRSPQPSTSTHCDNEVMDLTQAANPVDLHAPSTSRKHKYEMVDSFVEEQFQITDMSSEDAIEQAEIMTNEAPEQSHEDEYILPEAPMSPPPLASTPTSVIRTINDMNEPTNNIKSEKPLIIESDAPPLPPLILSPKPSTSSQDSHLNASHPKTTSNIKIGKPIVQKPKKLTLKLKNKSIPNSQNTNNMQEIQNNIKMEPELNIARDTREEQQSESTLTTIVKVEKADNSFSIDQKPHIANEPDESEIDEIQSSHVPDVEAGPSHAADSSCFSITYVGDDDTPENGDDGPSAPSNDEEKMQYYPIMYIPHGSDPNNQVPLSWVQRFSPQYVPFDERSSYMEIDGSYSKSNSGVSLTSEGDTRNGQSSNSFDERAPSADSCLNIRTDEKMPAKGEISEQESNGEIDNWNQVYQDPIQQYPSSYDVSTAQECWNLSNNKPEFMQHQQYATL